VALEATGRDLLAAKPDRFDVVLVGDLFYERPLAEKVLAFIEAARAEDAAVLVGDPRRSYFPRERFVEVTRYSVPVTRDLEDAEIKHTTVWRLR
jgi:predicted nicotinamide N-methyase